MSFGELTGFSRILISVLGNCGSSEGLVDKAMVNGLMRIHCIPISISAASLMADQHGCKT